MQIQFYGMNHDILIILKNIEKHSKYAEISICSNKVRNAWSKFRVFPLLYVMKNFVQNLKFFFPRSWVLSCRVGLVQFQTFL